jgi:uncharacterized protein YjdB
MWALTLSRVVAVLAGLTIAGACTDSNAPVDPFNPGEAPTDGTFMTLAPTSATISPGQTVLLHAQLHERLGTPIQGVTIKWRSHNQAVASVSDGGEVQGKAEGHAVIIASAQGRSQVATVHVLRRGPQIELKPNMDPAGWAR